MGFFSSLFKSYSEKQINKIIPIVDKIEALSSEFEAMTDEQLKAYTGKLKEDLASGKTLDDILPEAFALVREADWRVLGKRPFRVQLMGGILIHQGRIAEMRTGEGKTLVATLPAYLNALSGRGVHIVTVNDYLAERDSEEMGKVYQFLGLSTGLIIQGLDRSKRKAAYSCDITYGTNNELGFDYLRDNMAVQKEQTVQRGHNFAIVDEVDSILIDEARTPLIISGNSSKSTDLYEKVNNLVRGMSHITVKEYDAKNEYDIDKEYFEIESGALDEFGIAAMKKHFGFNDRDISYNDSFSSAYITESGKEKLIGSGIFVEESFESEAIDKGLLYFFTSDGMERAQTFLNRNFILNDDNKNACLLTNNCVKKLVSFFEFEIEHFHRVDLLKENYLIDEKGIEYAKRTLSLSDKDFFENAADKGLYYVSRQGVDRINARLSFDYFVDEKGRNAILTKQGIDKAERYLGINNLASAENGELQHHVSIAIKANGVMKRDVDYIVRDGNVVIVDSFTGRLMPGRRYNDGLHQAIEAKEGVTVQKESQTVASITFQNYFRLYSKLSGMTGTALTEDSEFREIYALDVVEVPTNRPMIRKDYNDAVYRTRAEKLNAIVCQIRACSEKGQPVLVGTVSVEKSEELSRLLKKEKISHNVLNAKQHDKEAAIIANAGTRGAVTISTNMAGRGTDIMLGGNPEFLAKEKLRSEGFDDDTVALASGTSKTDDYNVLQARARFADYIEDFKKAIKPEADKVREAGGLFIIGTERHESRRIDNQLRGRSGRQGDPGESRFYLSLEDDLFRLFGSDRLKAIAAVTFQENMPIEARLITSSIERAQKSIESRNFSARKHVLSYDDVMSHQRKVIYAQRFDILMQDQISDKIINMITRSVGEKFDEIIARDPSDSSEFFSYYHGALDRYKVKSDDMDEASLAEYRESLINGAVEVYHSKDTIIEKYYPEHKGAMREIEKSIFLRNLDTAWMEHLEAMDDLRSYVALNSYAQRDPVTMFKLESADMFEEMTKEIRENTVKKILSGSPKIVDTKRSEVVKATGYTHGGVSTQKRSAPVVNQHKNIGRNDDCYCGSGKKYKQCCLRKDKGL